MWTRNCERIASGLGTRKPLGRIFIFIFIFIFWAGSIVFFFATAFPFPGRLFFLPEFFCFRFGFRDWKVLGTRFFLGGRGSLYGTPLWKQKRNKTQSLTWSRIHWQRRKYVEPVSFFFFFFFFFFERVLWFDRCSFTDQWPILMIRRRFLLVGSLDFSNRTWNSVAVARFSLKEMETVGIDNGTTTTTKKRTAWKVGNSRLFLR